MAATHDLDRTRLASLLDREREEFRRTHPRSFALAESARGALLHGVPMPWMAKWAGGAPVFLAEARGARVTDVDGHEYVDVALGDTGSMPGHSPQATVDAIVARASGAGGITTMMPTEDAIAVGEELGRRFGVPAWQFALSATDANRFALRMCRQVQKRAKIMIFLHAYHGTVDETVATLDASGNVVARDGNVGAPVDPALTTKVVPFNDIDAVRAALRPTTRLVAVNFPNNPTGAVPDHATFRALVELCEERGVRLLCDEVYRGLERDPATTLTQAADASPTAVSVNVLSKSYGLPGLRVGWVACRDRAVLDLLEAHKHYTSICNAAPSELLASVAVEATAAIHARNRGIIAANLPLFDEFFGRHAELFDWQPPDGGCVAYQRYRGPDGAEEFCRRLVETEGVLLLPASVFSSALTATPADRFRIGVGRRDPGPALAAFDRFLTA